MKLTHGTHQKNTEISYVRSWHACFHYLRLPLVNYPMNSWHDILSCQLFPLFEVRSYELAMVSSYDSQLFPLLEVVYGESANGFLTWDIESQFLFLTLETFELLEHTSEMSVWMITCNFWSKFMQPSGGYVSTWCPFFLFKGTFQIWKRSPHFFW